MPKMTGLELYDNIGMPPRTVIFIIITAFGTIPSAVDAVKKGVYDYIPKPFTPDEVRIPLRRALEKRRLERENIALRSQIETRYSFQNIIGNSPEIRETFRVMRHAASSESNVLVTGESGTGKELVARAIHSNSVRVRRRFVTVNCGAIPDGLIESELFGHVKGSFTGAIADKKGLVEEADKGTLFLDEIGELSPPLQVKLLRVLQEGEFTRIGDTQTRKVNVRVVAATNKDLKKAIAEKLFREDLYYRLNVIPIELPPLRRRQEDIPLLVNHFIEKHKTKAPEKKITGIARDAMQAVLILSLSGQRARARELHRVRHRLYRRPGDQEGRSAKIYPRRPEAEPRGAEDPDHAAQGRERPIREEPDHCRARGVGREYLRGCAAPECSSPEPAAEDPPARHRPCLGITGEMSIGNRRFPCSLCPLSEPPK